MVSCLIQINTNSKANWMYPETAAISYMPKDQIIMNSLIVHGGSSRTKREISVPTQFAMRPPPERADPGVRCR